MSISTYAEAELTDSAVTIDATKARQNFRDLVDAAVTRGTRIVVTRNGKPMAAVVSLRDFERLRAADAALDRRVAAEDELADEASTPLKEFHARAVADVEAEGSARPAAGGREADREAHVLGEVVGQLAAGILAAAFRQAAASGVSVLSEVAVREGGAELLRNKLLEVIQNRDTLDKISHDAVEQLNRVA